MIILSLVYGQMPRGEGDSKDEITDERAEAKDSTAPESPVSKPEVRLNPPYSLTLVGCPLKLLIV